jgi:quercetin dioxygenase-like cupin family protein
MKDEKILEKNIIKTNGLRVNLIKLKPLQKIPMHKHKREKYDYVLRGSLISKNKTYKAGDLISNKKGSSHELQAGKSGCDFLVISKK